MCMNETQAAEAPPARPVPGEIGNENLPVVPKYYVLDESSPIEYDTQLASKVEREVCQKSRQFRRYNFVRRDAPPVKIFQPPDLLRFKAGCGSENFIDCCNTP